MTFKRRGDLLCVFRPVVHDARRRGITDFVLSTEAAFGRQMTQFTM
jgi:hypothetical protein